MIMTRQAKRSGALRRRTGLRLRSWLMALLLAVSPILAGCTPAEIEMSMEEIAVSFEEGGVERGLVSSVLIVQMAIPVIGMRMGSSFAP